MTYAKQVGGSPTSALVVLMLRTLDKALPRDIERLTAGIIHICRRQLDSGGGTACRPFLYQL